ncbi:TOM1-like protein 6 [Momordica charantia]|uniref:TOM1-like protein 6 n=1 Tax=Momordica charantia TaxID=3673 RepID=A0A6J1DSN9_MOMCH|nr:TOM1-like protein 6 [Momordica charantia]
MSLSSSSAIVAVEKATSDLLISPDWTMNIDICDSINSNQWQAKDVMKAVKRRLQHKSPRVQLLSLTLIETMVKNCGDYVHYQIAEKNILGEMIKILKKKADMNVRDKILVLLDSWQEAFGGPGGKHPQYYWAYDELRRSGIEFPKRSSNGVPIFTPPVSNPNTRTTQAGFGMPSNSSRRLDETMATEIEGLSLSSLDSMRNVMELLNDMLQAVNPGDSLAVKDEVIVDLVSRCRANQKKLMQMLTTTGDEELLCRGLELNDSLQSVLAKHNAIASGSVLSAQSTNLSTRHSGSSADTQKASEIRGSSLRDSSPPPNMNNSSSSASVARNQVNEDDEEEDEFAQLARRHSRLQPVPSPSYSTGTAENLALVSTGNTVTSSMPPSTTCTALALPDPPAPVRTSKEQDIIDLLSITLSTSSTSPPAPHTPPPSSQNTHQVPMSSSSTQGYHHHHSASEGQVPFNSYVVPWAQPGPQAQLQSQTQAQPQQQFQPQPQPQPQPQQQFQPQSQVQPQFNPQYAQYSSGYPPPPWAGSSFNASQQSNVSASNVGYPHGKEPALYTSTLPARPLQHLNSFPVRGINEPAAAPMRGGDSWTVGGPRNLTPSTAHKPFIPSYRLFEDLNVFGNTDARLKVASSSTSASLAGASGQSMVGGRK